MKLLQGHFSEVTLYKKDSAGNIRQWSICGDDYHIEMSHGVVGGELQDEDEFIIEGKAGRTRHEQMLSRINSRLEKKLDSGYLYSIKEAEDSTGKNRMGLLKPMLAKKFHDVEVEIDLRNCVVQHKLDGFRCLITKQNGKYIAYSRNGKFFDSIQHIFNGIALNEGETLDGELYAHGESLQTISSWAKKKQPDSLKLKYHIYDFLTAGDCYFGYKQRMLMADLKIVGFNNNCVCKVPTLYAESNDELMQMLKQAVADGYEGLMVRQPHFVYEDGKRSKGLLKLKSLPGLPYMYDDEFLVTGMNESSEGWAVLICATKDGKQFKVSAPGKVPDKEQVLINQENYIGRYLHIGYAKYTDEGKPFQPVALAWRNKYDE